MSGQDQQYTPDEETVREQYSREQPPHIGTVTEKRAEFDRFLAQVRRDAAREALDGLITEEEESFLRLHVKDAPIAAARCTHAAVTARDYRDTHYPEVTP